MPSEPGIDMWGAAVLIAYALGLALGCCMEQLHRVWNLPKGLLHRAFLNYMNTLAYVGNFLAICHIYIYIYVCIYIYNIIDAIICLDVFRTLRI